MACVFAELIQMVPGNDAVLRRSTLFRGSRDGLRYNRKTGTYEPDYTLLEEMIRKLGSPPESYVKSLQNKETQKWLRRKRKTEPTDLREFFPKADPKCLEL